MALEHKREIYIQNAKRTLIVAFGVFLIVLNMVRFCTDIRANSLYLYNYQPQEDIFAAYRSPAPMAVYSTLTKPSKTKILVLPKARLSEDDVLQNVIKTLQIYAPNQNMFFMGNEMPQALSKAFPKARFINTTKMTPKLISQTLEKELADENMRAVLVENLDSSDQTNALLALQAFTKKQNLRPRLFNLLSRTTLSHLELNHQLPESFDLQAQEQNLAQFLFDFEPVLRSVLKGNRDDMPKPLFDKASVMAFEETPSGCVPIYGAPDKTEAFLDGVENALAHRSVEKPTRLYILTALFEQENVSEESLQNVLEKGKDGVWLEYRGRHALMAPCAWKHHKTPKSFLRALRIQAGLSPDFWAEGTKVYLFRAVEVLKDGY